MRQRTNTSPFSNPILVGAVTIAVTIVAMVLAYNANNGLPFAPTRMVKVNFANGAELLRGNQVTEGGYRVGVVTGMSPVHTPDGGTAAQVTMNLDPSIPVPAGSDFIIRTGSLSGLKYVELLRAGGGRSVPSGYTFASGHSAASTDLDRLFNTFDAPTRVGEEQGVTGLGDSWAGRGPGVNEALTVLPDALAHLTPVAATLADPRNDLAGLLRAMDGTMRVIAPTRTTFAHLFTTMADTYGAIAHDPAALERTIAKSPSTLSVSTGSLAVQRPFYNDTASFSDALTRATAQLGPALPPLNTALETGPPVLRRSVALDQRLQGADRALRDLAADPITPLTLNNVLSTVDVMRPLVRYLGPYQTVCDYWNYFFTDLSDHMSESDPYGQAERSLLASAGSQNNSLSSSDSPVPANGEGYQPATSFRGDPQHLHAQAFGAAVDNRGNADCEAGQRGYLFRYAQGMSPRFDIASNSHTPGDQGPTFNGRARVPAGETFDRVPMGDPVLP